MESTGRNPHYEELLRIDFGLEFRGNGWAFKGSVNQDYASTLSNTELCLAVIKQLQAKLGFTQVCIVIGTPSVLIICNTKPPLGIDTSLKATGIADLIASIVRGNGKQVYEYQGVWLLTWSRVVDSAQQSVLETIGSSGKSKQPAQSQQGTAETCWLCKKNPADPTKAVNVSYHKVIKKELDEDDLIRQVLQHRNLADYKEKVTYHSVKVSIPRCGKCVEALAKKEKADMAGRGVGAIGGFILFILTVALAGSRYFIIPAILLLGALIFWGAEALVSKINLRSVVTTPESDWYITPEIRKLIDDGYHFGEAPAGKRVS